MSSLFTKLALVLRDVNHLCFSHYSPRARRSAATFQKSVSIVVAMVLQRQPQQGSTLGLWSVEDNVFALSVAISHSAWVVRCRLNEDILLVSHYRYSGAGTLQLPDLIP